MSVKHPIISITGSSGAGTSSVKRTFEQIFRREQIEAAGLKVSGTSPDGKLVEFVELDSALHPYYVATQAHPEFKSRPTKAHPLFAGLIAAAVERRRSQRLFTEEAAHA